jgi:hypothetical protein
MNNFFRWKAISTQMYVSVCLDCRRCVAAALRELQVDEAEAAHRCGHAEARRRCLPGERTASGVKARVSSHVAAGADLITAT